MNAVWREEPIVDALAETILVNRIAEVTVCVAVVVAERRGRHSKLVCRLKVIEDLPPVGLVVCAPTMALVHNDKVEEIGAEVPVETWTPFVAGKDLIEGEIYLSALDDLATL